jgi:hypothetical protein
MSFSRRFYRATAICSAISVATTLMLIFLPRLYGPVVGFDARIAAVHHPAYVLRSWVYLAHPFLVLAAALGVAAARRRVAAGPVAFGFLGFLLWAFTEAGQQALTLTTFDRWRRAYPAAEEHAQALFRTQIAMYDALWDAMYVLLLFGFLIGNIFLGMATWRARGLTRTVSVFFYCAAGLTLFLLSGEFQGPILPPVLATWLYPALQPLARLLIAVFLWRTPGDGLDARREAGSAALAR